SRLVYTRLLSHHGEPPIPLFPGCIAAMGSELRSIYAEASTDLSKSVMNRATKLEWRETWKRVDPAAIHRPRKASGIMPLSSSWRALNHMSQSKGPLFAHDSAPGALPRCSTRTSRFLGTQGTRLPHSPNSTPR